MTRRQLLAATAAATTAIAASASRLSFQGYIWYNMAARAKKPLAEMLDEMFATAPFAGYRNIELSTTFFTPELQPRVLALLRHHKLNMPSVYAGGGMHTEALAEKTIARALELGAMAKEFGCTAIVHNPDTLPKGTPKSDAELAIQAAALNRMGAALAAQGLQLRLHHHGVELENKAREVRHYLANTDPKLVTFCMDVEFVYRSQMSPPDFIEEVGPRLTELHLRNRTNNSPLQSFEAGDIDYGAVARTLDRLKCKPLIVVELAYHDDTVITRPFNENVRRSRVYAQKLFGL